MQIKKLPPVVAEKQSTTSSPSSVSNAVAGANDEMRIAWRYNNLDKVDSEQGGSSQKDGKNAYTFDLSQSVEDGALSSLDVTLFGRDESTDANENTIFHNPAYVSLLQKLREKMNEPAFDANGPPIDATTKKNLLRISIESLGSPLWYDSQFSDDLCLFLTILKATVRMSLSVCCITAPTHLFKHIVSYTFSLI